MDGKVTLKKEDFDKIQEQAAAYRVHQAELADFLAYREEFEAYKEDSMLLIQQSESRIQEAERDAADIAYLRIKEQFEEYEQRIRAQMQEKLAECEKHEQRAKSREDDAQKAYREAAQYRTDARNDFQAAKSKLNEAEKKIADAQKAQKEAEANDPNGNTDFR